MKVILEVFEGPNQGTRLEFDRLATLTVGRGPSAQLQLTEDAHFSRNHFLLEFDPPACHLRDLGSHNGTFVNDAQVLECKLRHGDIISGGKTRIRITVEASADDETLTFSSMANAATAALAGPAAGAGPSGTDVPLPQVVPGYEIVRTLGRSGLGVVYLARHQASGQPFALKVIVPAAATSEASLLQALRNVGLLRELNHPHLVRCHDMGLAEHGLFFAMEYVETVYVVELLRGRDQTEHIQTCCRLLCQVLEGLAYAHARAFVHGDVKPNNILVNRTEAGLHARLADGGLARSFQSASPSGPASSWTFLAPEQRAGAGEVTPAMDVYGAGASLYHLLSGVSPYDLAGWTDPSRAVLEAEPVPLAKRMPAVPSGLADVVHRALARDPSDRFATAEAMRQALLSLPERR